MNNNTTQAEQFRQQFGKVEDRNGWTSEELTKVPEDAQQHPESNSLSTGWIFGDGSELWETDCGTTKSLHTTRRRK